VSPKIENLISRIAGRVFVGPTLNRNETWLNISVTYTRDAFAAASSIRTWRPSLRWIAKYFIPEIRRMHAHNASAIAFIGEILRQRAIDEQDDGYERPVDALQWVRDGLPEKKKEDVRYQALVSLALGAAAINTTSMMVTNAIFDLACRPEYVKLLREEATKVLNELDGHWSFESMSKLKKMDSFIKESQRHTTIVSKSNTLLRSSVMLHILIDSSII
jgi:hypothetical protein